MDIKTILSYIDLGHMALPEFQRGYVWGRDQVRGLFDSLYHRHPVGGLLVWATQSRSAEYRGDGDLAPGVVKLLLDGQQRITSLYGVIRGEPPKFFDGDPKAFTGLQFHLKNEEFEFYQPIKMKDDPLWIDVTKLMQSGHDGLGEFVTALAGDPNFGTYMNNINRLLGVENIDFHIDEVVGEDKSIDVVVDIFNRVNSGGTKLSKGDLALAKICAEWPDARDEMRRKLKEWSESGYDFTLDWLLRSVNTVLTGEAKFQYLHDRSSEDIQKSLSLATKNIDTVLNLIAGRLGLDHDRVLFGRYAIPVMVRYLNEKQEMLSDKESDKLLFWYAQAAMWGRYSTSTESTLDSDLDAIDRSEGRLTTLIERLRLWHGGLRVEPEHFNSWSIGARFYPVLYMITRMGEAKDLGLNIPLRAHLLGKHNSLEVHHIFPKSLLYKEPYEYARHEVNSLANYCFLTKETNLKISNRKPVEYFEEIEEKNPGALASQWIPEDRKLWTLENFPLFLAERRRLLADEVNKRMKELLHGDDRWLEGSPVVTEPPLQIHGGITDEYEEQALEELNNWVNEMGFPKGQISYDFADEQTGEQKAVFDLAWPNGLQTELSEPVAVLINETRETIALASQAGFRCFLDIDSFKAHVQSELAMA